MAQLKYRLFKALFVQVLVFRGVTCNIRPKAALFIL